MMSPVSNNCAATADTGSVAAATIVPESSPTKAESGSSSTGSVESAANNGGFFPTVPSGSPPSELQVI